VRAARFVDPSGAERIGRLEESSVVDAGPAGLGGFVPSDEGWETVAGAAGPEYAVADARLLHPVVPAKLIGIGLNYRDHASESELDVPSVPVVFAMWPSALVGTGEAIVVPRDENRPDYEGEVAIVLGRTVKNASLEEARATTFRAGGPRSRRPSGSSRSGRASTRSRRSGRASRPSTWPTWMRSACERP
jgi:2-keto-4-pentenoate hydratase/2-oxohepta-3-ene-1,7-dioic acid hydratase in catechol pathway